MLAIMIRFFERRISYANLQFISFFSNADGRNQNVSRRDAETQRRKEIFLFFTVKIHPPHPDPPPTGGRGDDFHERG